MAFAKVGAQAFAALGIGAALSFLVPIVLALVWVIRKKERFTTVLVGAATFLVFAVILEKPLQALAISVDHPLSRALMARPVWLALAAGLFPGVFEETGRLVAFRTVLRKRTNRETAISHGLGHGGFEMMLILGLNYVTYLAYAVMINAGAFGEVVEQAKALSPEQAEALVTLAGQIAALTLPGIGLGLLERAFAVLFHVGASVLVFCACRDRGRFWLYPLAIVLHTAMDFVAALYSLGLWSASVWTLEATVAAFGLLVFGGAYFLLYRRDAGEPLPAE